MSDDLEEGPDPNDIPCKRGHVGHRRDDGHCRACTRILARQRYAAEPERHRSRAKEQYRKNPGKGIARAKKRYAENPKERRNYLLGYYYGITEAEFNALLESQDGNCAICKKQKSLCVDHDHSTGAVRGLLCRECNWALGAFRDDPDALRSAVAYLEKSGG